MTPERDWVVEGDVGQPRLVQIKNQKGVNERCIGPLPYEMAHALADYLRYEYNLGRSRGIAETKDKLAAKLTSLVMGLGI